MLNHGCIISYIPVYFNNHLPFTLFCDRQLVRIRIFSFKIATKAVQFEESIKAIFVTKRYRLSDVIMWEIANFVFGSAGERYYQSGP